LWEGTLNGTYSQFNPVGLGVPTPGVLTIPCFIASFAHLAYIPRVLIMLNRCNSTSDNTQYVLGGYRQITDNQSIQLSDGK